MGCDERLTRETFPQARSMVGTQTASIHSIFVPKPHIPLFQGFNGFQAATLSPLFFLSPALLGRAALYTCGVVGSLSYVGATAKNDTYLYMGGPLLAGVTVVALSALAPLALPLGVRGLAISEAVSLYGGLAVFSGCVLYEYVLYFFSPGQRG